MIELDKKIKDAAARYSKLAGMLDDMDAGEKLDGSVPAEISSTLVRLYYAIKFEEELEKYVEFLDEESSEETVEAVEKTMNELNEAEEASFSEIEDYAAHNREFADLIEGISVSSEVDGLSGYLYKLYKCESIIRTAYRSASKRPLYGMYKGMVRPQSDFDVVMNEEDYIMEKLGIDIYKLLEIRQGLVDEISDILKNKTDSNDI